MTVGLRALFVCIGTVLLCDVLPGGAAFVIVPSALPMNRARATGTATTTTTTPPIQSRFVSSESLPNHRALTTRSAVPSTTAAVAAVSGSIVSLPALVLASLIPSLIGYYKTEYGVSYAYGGAMAATAALVLRKLPTTAWTSLAGMHAFALLFYGVRLNLFLLYRELNIPYFRQVRERIEARASPNRLSRTPIVLGVAFLYACMTTPVIVSANSSFMTSRAFFSTAGCPGTYILRFLVGTTWVSFLLAALGDLTKTVVKANSDSPDKLVTSGVYGWLRHPNYTGEWFGWTASALAALTVPKASKAAKLAAVVGAFGIDFVLMQATGGLERRQKEKYGDSEEYQKWIQRSWSGFAMKPKEKVDEIPSTEQDKES